MSLKDRVTEDMKNAMRAKDAPRLSTIRMLLAASGRLRDGKEIDIPGPAFVRNLLMKELDKTQIGALLREFKLVGGD